MGADVSFAVSATDDQPSQPYAACTPQSGTTFAIGDTRERCAAADWGGNTTTAEFTVHVRRAAEQIAILRDRVGSLNPPTPVARSLDAELKLAQKALASGHPKVARLALAVFLTELRVLPVRVLPVEGAHELAAAANRIGAVIGL